MDALNPHAAALAEKLGDGYVAMVAIPSAEHALRVAGEDIPREQVIAAWQRHRAAVLESVGSAVEGLRAVGWRLSVSSRLGGELPDVGAERVIVVEADHIPPASPEDAP